MWMRLIVEWIDGWIHPMNGIRWDGEGWRDGWIDGWMDPIHPIGMEGMDPIHPIHPSINQWMDGSMGFFDGWMDGSRGQINVDGIDC